MRISAFVLFILLLLAGCAPVPNAAPAAPAVPVAETSAAEMSATDASVVQAAAKEAAPLPPCASSAAGAASCASAGCAADTGCPYAESCYQAGNACTKVCADLCAAGACPNTDACKDAALALDTACLAACGEACALESGLDTTQVLLPQGGCSDEPIAPEYHALTAAQAKETLDSGAEVTLVDVRTQSEYDDKHIPGAQLLPNEDIGAAAPAQLPDKDATILLYCRSGRRSKEAAEKLVALGYTQVFDFGGINDWPYETTRS